MFCVIRQLKVHKIRGTYTQCRQLALMEKPKEEAILPYNAKVEIKMSEQRSVVGRVKQSLWAWVTNTKNYQRNRMMYSCCLTYEMIVDALPIPEFFMEFDMPGVCLEFDMPDTFNSWFVIVELHVWILSARVMKDTEYGKAIQDAILKTMWHDVECRIIKLGLYGKIKNKSLRMITEQFKAAFVGYDEGIQSDDIVLAGIVWRRFFAMECDDAVKIERLVKYIRMQVNHLSQKSLQDLIYDRSVNFIPLRDINIERIK